MEKKALTYIISDINKALAFEWIALGINRNVYAISFILIVDKPSELEVFLQAHNIPVYVIRYKGKKDLLKVLWQVYRLLHKLKPSIVHCHLLYGSLIGLTAARLKGIKKRIYTRHHSDYHHRYFPKGIKWDRWCNSMATVIVAPSGAVKEVLLNHEKVPTNKVSVIHHGFDLDYFSEVLEARVETLRAKYKVDGYKPVVGVISRFTELKGIQYILPAFERLLSQHPNALLLLFNAKGDYEAALLQQLKAIPKTNYRLIAFESDLSAVYQLLDVFVQVSTDRTIEAFGQTYVEALASGVPSVFTLSGIAPDFIVDHENALVVPFRDSESIYQAMSAIIQNKSLCQKLIENGRKSVQHKFDLKVMIQKLEELYAG